STLPTWPRTDLHPRQRDPCGRHPRNSGGGCRPSPSRRPPCQRGGRPNQGPLTAAEPAGTGLPDRSQQVLVELLAAARVQHFLGPGDLTTHLAHSLAFTNLVPT